MALPPALLLDHLAVDAHRMAAMAAHADLSTSVHSCPGWSLADLIGHLGSVHRWATQVVRTGVVAEQRPPPDDLGRLAAWFADGADQLITTLRDADLERPCWGFGPPPQLAGFWVRRQALETSIHLWDAATCLGQDARIDPRLAGDGVDEVVSVLLPRQVRLGRTRPPAGTVRLRIAGTSATWELGGDDACPPSPDTATVTAPAATLFLLLWRRVDLADAGAQVEGDLALARDVLVQPLTP